jgi:hypothetical protein
MASLQLPCPAGPELLSGIMLVPDVQIAYLRAFWGRKAEYGAGRYGPGFSAAGWDDKILGFSQVIVRGQTAKRCVEGCWGMKGGIGGGGEIGWGWRNVGAVVGCHSDDERDMLERFGVSCRGSHVY